MNKLFIILMMCFVVSGCNDDTVPIVDGDYVSSGGGEQVDGDVDEEVQVEPECNQDKDCKEFGDNFVCNIWTLKCETMDIENPECLNNSDCEKEFGKGYVCNIWNLECVEQIVDGDDAESEVDGDVEEEAEDETEVDEEVEAEEEIEEPDCVINSDCHDDDICTENTCSNSECEDTPIDDCIPPPTKCETDADCEDEPYGSICVDNSLTGDSYCQQCRQYSEVAGVDEGCSSEYPQCFWGVIHDNDSQPHSFFWCAQCIDSNYCDDDDPSTLDECDWSDSDDLNNQGAVCVHTPKVVCSTGNDCDDHKACTSNNCWSGVCVYKPMTACWTCDTNETCSEIEPVCIGPQLVGPSDTCSDSGACEVTTVACEFGCSDGACLPEPECEVDDDCVAGVQESYCTEEGNMVERQRECTSLKQCVWEEILCEYGCTDGSCNPEPEPECISDVECEDEVSICVAQGTMLMNPTNKCEENYCSVELIHCAHGCENGECLPEPIDPNTTLSCTFTACREGYMVVYWSGAEDGMLPCNEPLNLSIEGLCNWGTGEFHYNQHDNGATWDYGNQLILDCNIPSTEFTELGQGKMSVKFESIDCTQYQFNFAKFSQKTVKLIYFTVFLFKMMLKLDKLAKI